MVYLPSFQTVPISFEQYIKPLSVYCLLQATIVRNAKDTAHTKAERNILEGVKVCILIRLGVCIYHAKWELNELFQQYYLTTRENSVSYQIDKQIATFIKHSTLFFSPSRISILF